MNRAVLVAVLLCPTLAYADAKADATVLLNDGVALLKAKDYAGALAKFEEAYATYPSPKIFANLASSLKALGRLAEAANYEQRYLDEGSPDAANRKAAQKVLAELDAKLGFVTITVQPADGAELRIDAGAWTPVGTLATWRVTPGQITVEVRRPGSLLGTNRVLVKQGATVALELTLEPEPVAVVEPDPVEPDPVEPERPAEVSPASRGKLGVIARALVDGKVRGWAPLIGAAVSLGDHVQVEGGAILGLNHRGGYLGVAATFLPGAFRPRVAAGVPVYLDDGMLWAVRGAGGVEWRQGRRLSFVLELGVEYLPAPGMTFESVLFMPTLGVEGRL